MFGRKKIEHFWSKNIETFFDRKNSIFFDQKFRFLFSVKKNSMTKNHRRKNQNPIVNPKLSQDSKNHT